LIPDTYTFVGEGVAQPADMLLGGEAIAFNFHSDDDDPPGL
jgi:hypothetical protein